MVRLPELLRRLLRRREAIFLACLGAAALLGLGLTGQAGQRDLAAREAQALEVHRQAIRGVEQQLRRTLEAIGTMHDIAAFHWLSRLGMPGYNGEALERLMGEATATSRFGVLQVAITDAAGLMLWSTVPGFRVVDLADREHIRRVLQGWEGPFLSAPIIGRVSNRPTINIARAIRSRDGQIAGVSVVALDPLGLSEELSRLHTAPDAVASVLRTDGTVMARSRDAREHLGRRLEEADTARLLRAPDGQSTEARTPEGEPIFTTWSRVEGWPLYVHFSQDAGAVLRASAEHVRLLRIILLCGVVAAGAAGLMVLGILRQREQRAEAEQAEALRRDLAEMVDALPGAAYRGVLRDEDGTLDPPLSGALARALHRDAGWAARLPALANMLDAEGRAARADLMRQVRLAGEGTAEYRLDAPGLGPRWLREQCRLLRDGGGGGGGAIEVVGLLGDITAEREIEAKAINASKLATLGEMATGVAHELNQPCAIIGLAAEVALLELEAGGPAALAAARGRLEEMLAQTDRMRRTIGHLRAFGQAEETAEAHLSLAAVVEGALGIAMGVLRDHGIRVSLALPEDLPRVRARLVPLEQAVVNLLLNARDAMAGTPPAEREIAIAAAREAERDGMVRLDLRDRGHGIPPDLLPRIFEPFFTTRPVGKGSGLGLSIAHGTLRALGGAIRVANHPDGGAVASLWLQTAPERR